MIISNTPGTMKASCHPLYITNRSVIIGESVAPAFILVDISDQAFPRGVRVGCEGGDGGV